MIRFLHVVILTFSSFYVTAFPAISDIFKAPTKIIIENKSGKPLKIQREVTTNLIFEEFVNNKDSDTLYIYPKADFRLVCSSLDSNRQNVYYTFILHPGETIYLKKLPYSLIAFSTQGVWRDKELDFFVEMQKTTGNFEGLLYYIPHQRKNVMQLLQKVKSLYTQRLDFLKKYKNTYSLSDSSEQELERIFFYRQYIEFLDHCRLDQVLNKQLLEIPEIKHFVAKFLQEVDKPNCVYYTEAMLWVSRLMYDDEDNYLSLYRNIRTQLSGKTLEMVFYSILEFYINKPEIKEIVNDFLSICSTEDLKNLTLADFGQYLDKRIIIDIPDYDSRSTTLFYNLKTKAIISWEELTKIPGLKYLEFWATWCGGCRAAIPYAKKIQMKYKDKGLKVVYISIDENVGAWESVSNKEEIPGEHSYLMLSQNGAFVKQKYNIVSIPRYMIIDNGGKILNADAYKPFNEQINKSLIELLR